MLINFSSVQFVEQWYENQTGIRRSSVPTEPSVHGTTIPADEPALYHSLYVSESLLERAKRLNLLDVWSLIVTFNINSNRTIVFRNSEAKQMYRNYQSWLFGKQKSKTKTKKGTK